MASNIPDDWFRPENAEIPDEPTVVQTPVRVGSTEVFQTPNNFAPIPPSANHDKGRNWALAILVVVAALLVGLLFGTLSRNRVEGPVEPQLWPGKTTAKGNSPAKTVYSGEVSQVKPVSVEASCHANNATDSLGKKVSYPAEAMTDGNLNTAWRCDGDGVGVSLTFNFKPGTELVRFAVYNGYGKRDPKTNDLMYGQYRRVSSVLWNLPSGQEIPQGFADNGSGAQQINIVPTTIDGPVTLTIQGSTNPGWPNIDTRDAVLISEVEFFTAAE